MKKETELVIIGAGIAGVSAAVYAKRCGLDFLIVEPGAVGGQILSMEGVDNYVGLGIGLKGKDLAANLTKTLEDLEIAVTAEEVTKIEVESKKVTVYTDNNIYSAQAVIIATGASFRKLGVRGEAEFLGKGVSYCAVCDGFFFKDKEVAVVGGGNTALEEALYLSEITRKVTLIHRRDQFRALDYLQKKVIERKNIEVIFNTIVKEIKGDSIVRETVVENVQSGQSSTLTVDGIFAAIGIIPNTGFLNNTISADNEGFILTDQQMKSSLDFIWAAGDCRKRPLKQLVTAASEGAIAAISVYKYLKGQYISA
ncbi:MAG: thioredoxin-disulfide reductase [Candidatus Omnitrophota bacterium]